MTRWFLLVLAVTAVAVGGCQMGRVSLAINKEHAVPFATLDVLPQQWEPEIVEPENTEP